MVLVLVRLGASMACENNVGLKPIDVAKDGEHMNTVKILRGDDHNGESPCALTRALFAVVLCSS